MLYAVHLSDGVCDPSTLAGGLLLGGGFLVAILLVAIAMRNLDPHESPKIGVLSAAFFVASLIHIPVGLGSAHLLLNGVVGVLLRSRAALAIVPGVALQALLFGHGGFTTIGLNSAILALPALIAGTLRPWATVRPRVLAVWAFALGVFTAGMSLALNCAVLVLLGKNEFLVLAKVIGLANLPFVIVEGLIVMIVVTYLAKVKPEWLGHSSSSSGTTSSNGTSQEPMPT